MNIQVGHRVFAPEMKCTLGTGLSHLALRHLTAAWCAAGCGKGNLLGYAARRTHCIPQRGCCRTSGGEHQALTKGSEVTPWPWLLPIAAVIVIVDKNAEDHTDHTDDEGSPERGPEAVNVEANLEELIRQI